MKIFPVVHIESPEQAVRQAKIAQDAEADGIFLISHRGASLVDSYNTVRSEIPELYTGLNYLSFDPLAGYEYTAGIYEKGEIDVLPDALWFDDAIAGIRTQEVAREYLGRLEDFRSNTKLMHTVRFLGGVSFKYTRGYSDEAEKSAEDARRLGDLIDVVTTSGAGTGHSPSPEKIRAMKRANLARPLAIASGVDEHNVVHYAGNADEVLVASSLETYKYSGVFIPEKVNSLIALAHSLE